MFGNPKKAIYSVWYAEKHVYHRFFREGIKGDLDVRVIGMDQSVRVFPEVGSRTLNNRIFGQREGVRHDYDR